MESGSRFVGVANRFGAGGFRRDWVLQTSHVGDRTDRDVEIYEEDADTRRGKMVKQRKNIDEGGRT